MNQIWEKETLYVHIEGLILQSVKYVSQKKSCISIFVEYTWSSEGKVRHQSEACALWVNCVIHTLQWGIAEMSSDKKNKLMCDILLKWVSSYHYLAPSVRLYVLIRDKSIQLRLIAKYSTWPHLYDSIPPHNSSSCTLLATMKTIWHTFTSSLVAQCRPTLKSTFTAIFFTASTCMFSKASLMVNKRWIRSRIKTLKWLPQQYTPIPDSSMFNYPHFFFVCFYGQFYRIKQNKQKTRSPASYAVIPVQRIQTRACAVCFAAREVMISSDGTLD